MMKKLAFAAAAVTSALSAVPAMAALSAADQTAIQTGITSADAAFYAIGGTVLIVLAGIWGFKRVRSLLGN